METGAIVVIIAAVAVFAILWRIASNKDETPRTPPQPSPQPRLESLTKAELVEVADDLGVEVRTSWTKAKIIQAIVIAQREGLN